MTFVWVFVNLLGVDVSWYSLVGKTSSVMAETESRGTDLADALLSGC